MDETVATYTARFEELNVWERRQRMVKKVKSNTFGYTEITRPRSSLALNMSQFLLIRR
jgi:hypothetical protein